MSNRNRNSNFTKQRRSERPIRSNRPKVQPLSPEAQAVAEAKRAAALKARNPTRQDLITKGLVTPHRRLDLNNNTKLSDVVRVALGLDYLPEGEKNLTPVDEHEFQAMADIVEELDYYARRQGRS